MNSKRPKPIILTVKTKKNKISSVLSGTEILDSVAYQTLNNVNVVHSYFQHSMGKLHAA